VGEGVKLALNGEGWDLKFGSGKRKRYLDWQEKHQFPKELAGPALTENVHERTAKGKGGGSEEIGQSMCEGEEPAGHSIAKTRIVKTLREDLARKENPTF